MGLVASVSVFPIRFGVCIFSDTWYVGVIQLIFGFLSEEMIHL